MNSGPRIPQRHALFAVAYTACACANAVWLYLNIARGNGGWTAFFTLTVVSSVMSVAIRIHEIGEAE